ncbi:MAG: hypothetical protein QM713_16005 [Arachnia sp.]
MTFSIVVDEVSIADVAVPCEAKAEKVVDIQPSVTGTVGLAVDSTTAEGKAALYPVP